MVEQFRELARVLDEKNLHEAAQITLGFAAGLKASGLISDNLVVGLKDGAKEVAADRENEDCHQIGQPSLVWEEDPETREKVYRHKMGNFSFFPERGQIVLTTDTGEKVVSLGPTENDILILLTERVNHVVPHDDFSTIFGIVNHNVPVDKVNLKNHIGNLRKKIRFLGNKDDSQVSNVIISHVRFGYRLVDSKVSKK